MKSAISSILERKKDARFWQYVALLQALLFAGIILYKEFVPDASPDVLVVNDSGYYMGKLENFATADDLHQAQAEIATLCLFQRSPNGPEYEDRMSNLFGPEAFHKAKDLIDAERDEFRLKSLHQKVEIAEIKVLRVRGNAVLVSIKGQLLRTGAFESKPFVEALGFGLEMRFLRNPNMAANGYYPSIVQAFDVTTTSIPAK
jgi:hypothetical protein